MMSAKDNKFLTLGPNAIMTPRIEKVIVALDPFFEKHNHKAVVYSGLRVAEDQLRIIRDFMNQKGFDKKYPETMICGVDELIPYTFNGNAIEIYKWQLGWSALLNSSTIINPPKRAICLMNYINAFGINKKGMFIEPSPHFLGGAFNIGGGSNGVNDELAILLEAMPHIPEIKGYLCERNNNALHIDCA